MTLQPDDPTMAQVWVTGEPPDQTVDFYIPRGNQGIEGPRGPVGPSLAVGTVETVTGPAAPGTVGPQGLTGPKGDPGGIVRGTVLDAQNLNNVILSGVYRRTATSTGLKALNYPNDSDSGVLLVFERLENNTVLQEWHSFNSAYSGTRGYYRRVLHSGTIWHPWQFMTSTRIDQSAGRAFYQWDEVNNRDQLVYGDTGWRELGTTNLINGWTANSVLIRRVNNMVSFKAYYLNPGAATADIFMSIPAGFVRTHGAGTILFPKTNAEVAFLQLTSAGMTFGPRGTTHFGTGGFCEVQWSTVDAWPTTLPGTASGAVPNV